jgi:hypothetical protein
MGQLICKIDGVVVQAPEGWQGVQSLMTWDNDSVQANITTTNFTFVADAAKAIKDFVNANGYFTSLPITFEDYEDSGSSYVFDGYIDFTEGYVDLTPSDETLQFKVQCTIKERNQIDTFKAKAMGTTWALLESQGYITSTMFSKILYVKQKPFDALEVLMIEVQIMQTSILLAQAIADLAKNVANIVAHTVGGVSGPIAGGGFTIAVAVIQLVYSIALLVALIKLYNKILEVFLPMPRYAKALTLKQYMNIACNAFGGYKFSSSIIDLNTLYIFPSKDLVVDNKPLNSPSTDTGYFNVKDYGYIVGEYFQLVEKLFNAKFKIDNAKKTVHFEPLNNDVFWLSQSTLPSQSTYQMEDVYISGWRPNTEEISGVRVVKFETDDYDIWTKEKYSGTAHEIHTEVANIPNAQRSLIKGYDEVRIELALGNQKENKNKIEEMLGALYNGINDIANIFGIGVSPTVAAYQHIASALKIQDDQTKMPKLLKCVTINIAGGQYKVLANNQRDVCGAKYFYDNYIIDKSFVANNYRAQWRIYENIIIPFSRSSFVAIGNNNYFYNSDGDVCRMEKITWEHDKDKAVATYRIRKPYDTNLKETIITI